MHRKGSLEGGTRSKAKAKVPEVIEVSSDSDDESVCRRAGRPGPPIPMPKAPLNVRRGTLPRRPYPSSTSRRAGKTYPDVIDISSDESDHERVSPTDSPQPASPSPPHRVTSGPPSLSGYNPPATDFDAHLVEVYELSSSDDEIMAVTRTAAGERLKAADPGHSHHPGRMPTLRGSTTGSEVNRSSGTNLTKDAHSSMSRTAEPETHSADISGKTTVLVDPGAEEAKEVSERVSPDDTFAPSEDDTGIECACCFGEDIFSNMVQCPDGHLFCSTCISQYAATQLGVHNTNLVCMDASDCRLPFPESELRRVLSPKLLALYSRLLAQKAVEAAGLAGLEECPFCDWKCIMEVSIKEDPLFRCGNAEGGCGVVSCRRCKKKDHLPHACKDDRVLQGQHLIEEAMTHAMIRRCPNPKCAKPFVKVDGCNVMTCSYCRTQSCYVCRQMISGHGHFTTSRKCGSTNNVNDRIAAEVEAAAKAAREHIKRTNPDIDTSAIKVDIPPLSPRMQAHQARLNGLQELFQRQANMRQADTQRLRAAKELEANEVAHELAQQRTIARESARKALSAQSHLQSPPPPPSADSARLADAYAHAYNLLHGK